MNGAVLRQFRRPYLVVFGLVWAALLVVWPVLGALLDPRFWYQQASNPPRFAVLALAAYAASGGLQLLIPYGVTRRRFMRAAAAFFGLVVLGFGAVSLAAHSLAAATAALTGVGSHPFTLSARDALALLLVNCLVYAAYACSGWLAGAVFYRFGARGGIALVLPAMTPAVVATEALVGWPDPARAGATALALAAAPVAVGLVVGYLLGRDVAIRKVSG